MKALPLLCGVLAIVLQSRRGDDPPQSRRADDQPPPGFRALFAGKDLTGWVPVNVAPDTCTVRDGSIVISGVPTGFMRTDRMYENFVLECDWRHLKEGGNSGVFVWCDGVPAVGSEYTRGTEVQVLDNGYAATGKNEWYTTHGDIFAIHGATMTAVGRVAKTGVRSFPSEERSKSAPEWNHYRLTADRGELRLEVNGKEVTVARDCVPRKGYLALESEGSEVHFKNIFIKELPASNTPAEQTANAYAGFVPLFDGKDFAGWSVPEGDNGHWKVQGSVIDYDARSEASGDKNLWTQREYADYTLIVDWRIKETPFVNAHARQVLPDGTDAKGDDGQPIALAIPDSDSGVFLRSDARFQVNIWCWPVGSGEMYGVRTDPKTPAAVRAGVTPRVKADRPIGSWNRYEITVLKGTVRVVLNGTTVIPEVAIPGLPERGRIGFQHHGAMQDGKWTSSPSLVQFRNVFVKELKP